MRLAALALCLAMGCASQKSAESHADYVAEVQTVRTEGAERVTEVVEEFEDGLGESLHPPAGTPASTKRAPAAHPPSGSPVSPDHGILVKRTTTTIDRAPVTTTTHSGLDVKTDAKMEDDHTWFHLGFLAWAGIAAGAVAAALLAYKFRSGLLGGVLRLLGR